MDENYKKKWIEMLRSDKYKQGRGRLRNYDQYCCLGVICDIVNPDGWVLGDSGFFWKNNDFGQCLYLPEETRESLDIGYYHERHLADMNDAGKSFAEIADYIERNL